MQANPAKVNSIDALSPELEIFGEQYRVESKIDDNSLKFSTTDSTSYYALQLLDKDSKNTLLDIEHENVARVIVTGKYEDVKISYENFSIKSDQTFLVCEFVDGKLAHQYFQTQDIIIQKYRLKKLQRVRSKKLISLMLKVIDVLLSCDQPIMIRLADVVIANAGDVIKIINIQQGTDKVGSLSSILSDAVAIFQDLLSSMKSSLVNSTSSVEDVKDTISEIEDARDKALKMQEIIQQELSVKNDELPDDTNLKNIKNKLEDFRKSTEDEISAITESKDESTNSNLSKKDGIIEGIEHEQKAVLHKIDEKLEQLNRTLNGEAASVFAGNQKAQIVEMVEHSFQNQNNKISEIVENTDANINAIENIKHAFVKTFALAIDSLANNHELSSFWPFSKDDSWHTTILVKRPSGGTQSSCPSVLGCLTPVLMRTYKNKLKYASSDWISNKTQLVQIHDSYAGIPISWYNENYRKEIKEDGINDTLIIQFSDGTRASSHEGQDDTNKTIRFVLAKNVKEILAPKQDGSKKVNEYVSKVYKEDTYIGWEMVTDIGLASPICKEKLQYLISIPFYTPFSNGRESTKENKGSKIIAVAHFEIEQTLGDGMIEKIAEKLAYFIQDRNCFGLNDFHSDILKDVDIRKC